MTGLDQIYHGEESIQPEFRDAEVTFHIGLHKTGSTWLFSRLVKPHDGTSIISITDHAATRAAFVDPPFGDFSIARAHDCLRHHLEAARDAGLPLLLRDESLASQPTGGSLPREVLAQRIKLAFPKSKVIVTIREQNAVILSQYGQYIRGGRSSRLEDFVRVPTASLATPILRRQTYEYDRLYQLYTSVFGSDGALIIPMEQATRDVAATALSMSEFIGADLSVNDEGQAQKSVNESWGWRALLLARHLNKFVPHDSRGFHKSGPIMGRLLPVSLAYRYHRLEKRMGLKDDRRALKRRVADLVGDHFAASNRRFADQMGIDLRALGYVMDDAPQETNPRGMTP